MDTPIWMQKSNQISLSSRLILHVKIHCPPVELPTIKHTIIKVYIWWYTNLISIFNLGSDTNCNILRYQSPDYPNQIQFIHNLSCNLKISATSLLKLRIYPTTNKRILARNDLLIPNLIITMYSYINIIS